MKKVIILLLLLFIPFIGFSEIEGTSKDIIIDNKIMLNDYKDFNIIIDNEKEINLIKQKTTTNKDVVYNKYGGVVRNNLDNATIVIKDKSITVKNYVKTKDNFTVNMYVGTHNVTYGLYHSDKYSDTRLVLSKGEYIGEIVSVDNYINFETDKFSTIIASLPIFFLDAFYDEFGEGQLVCNPTCNFINLNNYVTGVNTIFITELMSGETLNIDVSGTTDFFYPLQFSNGQRIQFERDFDYYGNTNIYFRVRESTTFNPFTPNPYNFRFGLNFVGSTQTTYANLWFTMFYESSDATFSEKSFSDLLIASNKGWTTSINLDPQQTVTIPINELFYNYYRFGFRLRDSLGNPIPNSYKDTNRAITGCTSVYSDIYFSDIKLCRGGWSSDSIVITTGNNAFTGEIDLFAYNSFTGQDELFIPLDITIDTQSDTPPTQVLAMPDKSMLYNDYDFRSFDLYFDDYTNIEVNVVGQCIITQSIGNQLDQNCNIPNTLDLTLLSYSNEIALIYETGTFPATYTVTVTASNLNGNIVNTYTLDIGEGGGNGLTSDLIAYYKLDDDVIDSVGSNDATLVGSPSYTTGIINNGLLLSGDGQYMTTPALNLFGSGKSATLSLWFSQQDTTKDVLFSVRGDTLLRVQISSTNQIILEASSGGQTSTLTFTENDLHHFVMVVDNTNVKIYVDNVLFIDTTITYGSASGSNYWFGALLNNNPNVPLNGKIDEIGLWSRALSVEEITELYNNGNGLSYDNFDGGSIAIPPGISAVIPDYTGLEPFTDVSLNINNYFFGYNQVVVAYFDNLNSQWVATQCSLGGTETIDYSGDLNIYCTPVSIIGEEDTIVVRYESKGTMYSDSVRILASNEVGIVMQQFELGFLGFEPNTPPVNINQVGNIYLGLNEPFEFGLNTYVSNYHTVTLSLDNVSVTITKYDTCPELDVKIIEFIPLSVYLEDRCTGNIFFTGLSSSDNFNYSSMYTLELCNDIGCVTQDGIIEISENGTIPPVNGGTPPWFPEINPDYQLFYAIIIIIGTVVFITLGTGDMQGKALFGTVAGIGLFILFALIGWIPIWAVVLLISIVVMVIAMTVRNMITGS